MAKLFLTPIDLNKLEIRQAVAHVLSSAPGTPAAGQFYYDSVLLKLYYYNGSAWVATDASGAVAPSSLIIPNATSPAQVADGSAVWDSDDDVLTVGTGASRKQFGYLGTTVATAGVAGDSAVAGTSFEVARIDHKHSHTAFATVTAQTSFGASSTDGAAGTYARSDHAHGTPAHLAAAHSAIKVSDLAAPSADVSFGGFKITSLGTPTADTDGATKAYVDGVATGLDIKNSVRVATTAAGTLASTFENGDSVDGVTLATGNRILIKNQASGSENGIYTVNASGAPTRATDADASAEVTPGMFTFVEEGTTNADTGWVLTTNATITLGSTALVFSQFSASGNVTAGTGLTRTGDSIDVIAGTGIVANADDVAVLRTDANGRVPLRYAASFGDGAATSYNIDHNLNSLDVIVQVFRNSDGVEVEVDKTRSTVNRVILAFAVAPTSNQYRAVVLG